MRLPISWACARRQCHVRPEMRGWVLALALAVLFQAAWMSDASARVLEVGRGKPYPTPSAAAALAESGDTVRIAPGRYRDCAIWRAHDLVIEGTGARPEDVEIADLPCSGVALFITVGDRITVRNLTLARAKVPNDNGAGIRAKGADLTVERVIFRDNENGILGEPNPLSVVTIRESVFERNGVCTHACAHGIYFNLVKLLRVERCRYVGQRAGHHIKSRAARTEIIDNDIVDGPSGTASYLIDIPYGGDVLIRGNRMSKGPRSENTSTAIMLGAEGVKNVTRDIRIEDNRFENAVGRVTAFVDNRTGVAAILSGNTMTGPVEMLRVSPPT